MKRFNRILCVVDPLQPAEIVLERAVTLAENNQAELTVVSVAPLVTAGIGMTDGGPISADIQQLVIDDLQQRQAQAVAPYRARIAIETGMLVGTPYLEVIREVIRGGHDLVIEAPEDPGWLDRLFGSDNMHLLRKCPCPVWFIKRSAAPAYRRVLAVVDVDAEYPVKELPVRHALNVQILELAASLAVSDFAELHVAHAWEAIGESALRGAFLHRPDAEVVAYTERVRLQHDAGLDRLLHEVIDARGVDVAAFLRPTRHLIKGPPRREIPALAKRLDADLVVMGTVARTGVPGFFIGNTAEAILDQIECSVLAVKPAGFMTPVTPD